MNQIQVPHEIESAIFQLATYHPAFGAVRVANELKQERGLTVSPAGVRYVWQCYGLGDMTKRVTMWETRKGEM